MKKIDMHTHILPEYLPKWANKFGYDGFIHLEHNTPGFADMMKGTKFFRRIKENCWSPEKRLEEHALFNIDLQVICTIPVMFAYWAKAKDNLEVAQYLNDHIAEVVHKYPKQFIALATLPLQDPELSIQELERCMKNPAFAGVQIGSHVNSWNLNAKELFPVFEACERLGACVLVHPWDMMGTESMPDYWLPWLVGMPAETSRAICSMIFGGVFERLPNLRVAFAHGGGAFSGTVGRVEHGFTARPDLVATDNAVNPRDYLGKFWVDTAVFDANFLRYIIGLYGSEKICVGSDYPFPLGEAIPGGLVESMTDLDGAVRQNLMYRSALSWLGRKEADFM